MNFGQLKTLIASTAHRSDLTASIPNFVVSAETKINNTLRVRQMAEFKLFQESDRTSPGADTYTLPVDFLEASEVYSDATENNSFKLQNVQFKDLLQLRQSRDGKPTGYFISYSGDTIVVRPTPAQDVTFNMLYWKQIPALTSDASTTDLLTDEPDVYLYGALKYLGIFVQDIELSQIYHDLFINEMTLLNEASLAMKDDGPVIISGASQWA